MPKTYDPQMIFDPTNLNDFKTRAAHSPQINLFQTREGKKFKPKLTPQIPWKRERQKKYTS